MIIKQFLLIASVLISVNIYAQDYDYYLGGDQSEGIIITTSSDLVREGWGDNQATGDKTMGAGLEGKMMEASRFLAQATLGYNQADLQALAGNDFEDWIDNQFKIPKTSFLETLDDVYAEVYQMYLADGNDPEDFRCRPVWYRTNYAWWQMIMTGEDVLRQRIALALSEILVVSMEGSTLTNFGYGLADYYDILVDNAFGNYYDIIEAVSLHPTMGEYLSSRNNPKASPEAGSFPDENYAREVMQLFTIGLLELNNDGSNILDDQGNTIRTYSTEHIKEMAKVFTGLGAGGISSCTGGFQKEFGMNLNRTDLTVPMEMYEEWHQKGEKYLMNDFTIPSGQSGMQDIQSALHFLVDHHNTGPFIAKKLIKLLIKSHPSPEYISRVADAFADNGNGVRGDMKSVVKAIFLDEEARDCSYSEDPFSGKLKEPILRMTQYAKAIDKITPDGRYWNRGTNLYERTLQHPLASPTVFNFFDPDYIPNGVLSENNLTAPEFEILNTVTSLEYYDLIEQMTFSELLFFNYEPVSNVERRVFVDIYHLMNNAREPEVLINKLDLLFTHGQLSDRTRKLMRRILDDYPLQGVYEIRERTMLALYFLLTSPDYLIEK